MVSELKVRAVIILFFLILTVYAGENVCNNKKILFISTRCSGKCYNPTGDYLQTLFLKSIIDYCNRHDYTFSFRTNVANPHLHTHWNKIGHLLDVFENKNNSKYEWICWIDNDTLITRPTEAINFSKYSLFDIVIAGNENLLKESEVDLYKVLNSGVIFLRNTEISRLFLEKIKLYALLPIKIQNELAKEAKFKNYEYLQDQKAITLVIKQNEEIRKQVYFEEYSRINGFWEGYKDPKSYPIIKHWAGCKFCEKPAIPKANDKACYDDFIATYNNVYYNNLKMSHDL